MNYSAHKYSARKVYADYPFAHRQHLHSGHCSHIHGHNWKFTLYFSCSVLDTTGFVIDFGELGFIKEFLDECFDHALVLNRLDPSREYITSVMAGKIGSELMPLARILVVDNCSCEGIAAFLMDSLNHVVQKRTNQRVWIHSINVSENSKNSATLYSE